MKDSTAPIFVPQIARGLPNHFSSTDPRTVELAKFLCEFLTETIKLYEKRTDNVPEHLQRPDHELCQEVLGSFHLCSTTNQFWLARVTETKSEEKSEAQASYKSRTDAGNYKALIITVA